MAHIFTKVTADEVLLTDENALHISKSLRMNKGETLTICSDGIDYECEISEITSDSVKCKVISKRTNEAEPTTKVTLFQCLPKGDKLELVIQKAVELGVHKVVPVLSSRCVSRPDEKKSAKKTIRYNKISYSACEQSRRGELVEVEPTISFAKAADCISNYDTAILFYEGGGTPLKNIISDQKSVCIFIGPEGGFSPEEVELLKSKNAVIATLGKRILRTETAPLAALASIMLLTGNMD